MLGRDEEVLRSDAYIDALIAGHGAGPAAVPGVELMPPLAMRHAIAVLERLPRFHPSFVFEESLAARLRGAVPRAANGGEQQAAEVVALPLGPRYAVIPHHPRDRRLLVGGAIASTVSLAGAAVLVRAAHHRRGRSRSRMDWLS